METNYYTVPRKPSLQSNENKDNFTRDANIDGYRFNFEEFS